MKATLFIILSLYSYSLFAQSISPDYFLKELAKDDNQQSLRFPVLVDSANTMDSTGKLDLLRQMEEKVSKRKSKFLQARFLLFKNALLSRFQSSPELTKERFGYVEKALKIAEQLDNSILIADICSWYSTMLPYIGRQNESQFYFWKSIALIDKAGTEYFTHVGERLSTAGAILYHLREYDNCIKYARKAMTNKTDPVKGLEYYSCLNNIGLAYKKKGIIDSAIYYFDKSAAECAKENKPDHIWVTIPQANKAQIWFAQQKYDQAKPLFEADYTTSLAIGEYRNAANNLQWLAKINLVEGKIDSAFEKTYRAINILNRWTGPEYLANTYETMADIYKFKNNVDSSRKYSGLYTHLHDSIEVASTLNSTEVIRLKLNDEQHLSAIESLEKQRENEKLKRNGIIAVIVLLAVIGWMYYNRQLTKQKQQRQLKESELQAAKDKMDRFVKTIDEKSVLVEQLQEEVKRRNPSQEVLETLEDLKQKTILTEDEWVEFQNLFEKIYPGFFEKLKINYPGITYAELRFAAIIRLQLNNTQAGAMLGISSRSASKTRFRLRQRINIDEKDLDHFILSL